MLYGVESPYVVGYSPYTSVWMPIVELDLVDLGLTGIDSLGLSTFRWKTSGELGSQVFAFECLNAGVYDEVVEAVNAYMPHRKAKPRSSEGLRKNLRVGEDDRLYWHWDPAFISGDRTPGSVRNVERLRDAARRIDVPTLLVRGKMSDVVSEEGVKDFLQLIPGARAVDVSGAGHMVSGDQNDVFNDAILEFLAEVQDAGRCGTTA